MHEFTEKDLPNPETGKEVSRTYVGGITCAWPNVTVNHEPKSQKNELIYSNGKIVGAKAIVEYRFYTHTTLGENNHIVMKTGDVFSDGHVVTEKEESTYEKHELNSIMNVSPMMRLKKQELSNVQ